MVAPMEDRRKQLELKEARKAGLVPAEVDEDGREINPHIPQYLSSAPWYLNQEGRGPSLKHQRKWKPDSSHAKSCCGAMTHDKKACADRPRKLGAKWTDKNIAADEKIEAFQLDYDGKRHRWNGYDAAYPCIYNQVRDEARSKYLKERQFKKLEKIDNQHKKDGVSDIEDDLRVDEAKVEECKQTDFARVKKRVRTTGGGSTGTVRNLRIREDTAKYLLNLDVNSAHYDPKTHSMREDPLPNMDANDKLYVGDNLKRVSGEALEFKRLNSHAWEAYEKGHDIHLQAAPSQAELHYRSCKMSKEKFMSQNKATIIERYGNAAAAEEEMLPRELLLGQSERNVEYDRTGRIIKGRLVFQRASTKKAFISITTRVIGVHGGRIINGVTNAANRQLEIATALVLPVSKPLKPQQIL
ncbi:hypothetical protein AAHA92_24137 [Salvia divinorum]|uniref:Pre-mRNA-splicing factor SLU7 n=1 Tax=Salvia divinorum TaxID=28513 RepID=A0ABD1G6F1_SALDI